MEALLNHVLFVHDLFFLLSEVSGAPLGFTAFMNAVSVMAFLANGILLFVSLLLLIACLDTTPSSALFNAASLFLRTEMKFMLFEVEKACSTSYIRNNRLLAQHFMVEVVVDPSAAQFPTGQNIRRYGIWDH
jgi:hypothetical protein